MQNKDISNAKVLEEILKESPLDFDTWKEQFENSETEQAVLEDLQRVQSYGIKGAPALVIDQKYLIRGAQPQGVIEKTIEEIAEKEGFQLQGLQTLGEAGEACRFVDGQWICD